MDAKQIRSALDSAERALRHPHDDWDEQHPGSVDQAVESLIAVCCAQQVMIDSLKRDIDQLRAGG